jgi:hypothetical protein
MSQVRQSVVLKLAAAAYEMDLDVLRGLLHRDEQGEWRVGERLLADWLAAHDGEELVLVLGSLEDEREIEVRTCRTCGRDYTDLECPHCRERRIRLRGR